MIIALDIGNSDITCGVWYNHAWLHTFRMPTDPQHSAVYYYSTLRDFFIEASLKPNAEHVIISSVVPELTEKISKATQQLTERNPVLVGQALYGKLPVQVINPQQIGADLVCNALAAHLTFSKACVVVDFGTALTFTVVSAQGQILGVSIAPGLRTAIKALTQNTAQLFDVPLQVPVSVLGKNTTHAIQAGVLHGYEGLVSGMLKKIKDELPDKDVAVIATGGLSSILPALQHEFTKINPMLTLDGLRLITEYMKH